jgi:hypothetical protein
MAVDAYDVMLMPASCGAGGAGWRGLERRFAAFDAPLVVGAEMHSWPDRGAAPLYPLPPPHHARSPFRFVNRCARTRGRRRR